jgi:group I intron endonuclease
MSKRSKILQFTLEDINTLSFFGVYIIKNKIDNRVYIGSTSVSFLNRWREHIGDISRNTHHCLHLQNFVNKYGINKISFSILEIINDINILSDREQYWLDYYGFDNCFNIQRETTLERLCGEKNYKYLKIDIPKVISLFKNGIRVPSIAKQIGCSESKIKSTLYNNGVDSVRYSNNLPLTEIYFRNMLGKESLRSLSKEFNIDPWTLRYRLREAGFPSRDFLILEYYKKFKEVKIGIKEWCRKLPFDYCTFLTLKKNEEKN